ncbi:MAG: hypothetical protein IT374_08135 [Polyangiaceae bacterium]|nr:hypothetical protein [Polyangiaceae bacterium]
MQANRTLRLILAITALTPAAAAQAGVDEIIEVDAALRALPLVTVVPTDAASVAEAREVAKVLSLSALFDARPAAVGAPAGGRVVEITLAGDASTATTTRLDNTRTRRLVARSSAPARDTARLVDAVVEDLTGVRSHLSGELLIVDAGTPGERRVRVLLGTGAPLRDVSPPGLLARGPAMGPGGKVWYAAAARGAPLQLFVEGQAAPVALREPGFVAAVALTADGRRGAVVLGNDAGGSLWTGVLGGAMTEIPTAGLALSPTFSIDGDLAYVAGPPDGPTRVYVGDRAVTPPGVWASAPSFCAHGGAKRLVYAQRGGGVAIVDLSTRAVRGVGLGSAPACSPDGRTVALSRGKGGGKPRGGVWLVADDGAGPHQVYDGEAAFIRWLPGAELPPPM